MAQASDQEKKVKVWLMEPTGPYKLQVKHVHATDHKPLQNLVGGYFEFQELATQKGISYKVVMNEEAPPNEAPNHNFARFIPEFGHLIRGNAVVLAVGKNGQTIDMDLEPKQLQKMAKKHLPKLEKKHLEFMEQMKAMGVKIVYK